VSELVGSQFCADLDENDALASSQAFLARRCAAASPDLGRSRSAQQGRTADGFRCAGREMVGSGRRFSNLQQTS